MPPLVVSFATERIMSRINGRKPTFRAAVGPTQLAHSNGIESFWSMLKRGYVGIYHKFNQKHLDRYVKAYAERRNLHELDSAAQMSQPVIRFSNVKLS